MIKLSLFALLLIAGIAAGYSCDRQCYGNMCCSTAPGNSYYLTSFCDSEVACGSAPSCSSYFTADSQRFGCGKYLNICSGNGCVKAKVVDAGPNIWVEQKAGRAIIDASPPVCRDLFGSSSCGWSDRYSITAVVASSLDSRPLGPFNATDSELVQMVLDHEYEMERCAATETCRESNPSINIQ
eukprot:gene3942-4924_t